MFFFCRGILVEYFSRTSVCLSKLQNDEKFRRFCLFTHNYGWHIVTRIALVLALLVKYGAAMHNSQ